MINLDFSGFLLRKCLKLSTNWSKMTWVLLLLVYIPYQVFTFFQFYQNWALFKAFHFSPFSVHFWPFLSLLCSILTTYISIVHVVIFLPLITAPFKLLTFVCRNPAHFLPTLVYFHLSILTKSCQYKVLITQFQRQGHAQQTTLCKLN